VFQDLLLRVRSAEDLRRALEGDPIGSLQRCAAFWRTEVRPPETIMRWIDEGIDLDFFQPPPVLENSFLDRNHFTEGSESFVDEEILRQLYIGACEPDEDEVLGFTVPLFVVPKPGPTKFRLITDLTDRGRGPNAALGPKPFKMEHLDDLLQQIGPEWFAIVFDLRAGFNHLWIAKEFRRFFRFMWRGKRFHMNCMPFGPRHSPWIFNKVVREFIKILRRGCTVSGCKHTSCRFRAAPFGVVIVYYVDDFCLAAKSREQLIRIRDEILVPLMNEMGWIRALDKGNWDPQQCFQFLGLEVDTRLALVLIPEKKLGKYRELLLKALAGERISARKLASVAGKLVSVLRAFAPSLIYTRSSFAFIAKFTEGSFGWDQHHPLTDDIREDLTWILDHLDSCNGRFAWRPAQVVVLATDACTKVGWGGSLRAGRPLKLAQGVWPEGENRPIHILEMLAILYCILAFGEFLRGRRIQIFTDNQICFWTLPNGSSIPEISRIVKLIHNAIFRLDAVLVDVAWISTILNVIPDALSRYLDLNDWYVAPGVWEQIFREFPTLSVDRFANEDNTKLRKYNSRYAHPGSEGYNAMAQMWSRTELSYACPPLAMVGPVLRLIREQRTMAVVVVPVWTYQPWWPLLQAMEVRRLYLGQSLQVFRRGRSGYCAPHAHPQWKFLAVLVDGTLNA
jgi:hypothetical protein